MFVPSGDVHSPTAVGILDALELHAQVLVVVALHRDAVGLHPVHNQAGQLHRTAAYVRQVLPQVHGEDVVYGLGHCPLAVMCEEVVAVGTLGTAVGQDDGHLSLLPSLCRGIHRTLSCEVAQHGWKIGARRELTGSAKMMLAPLQFVARNLDIDEILHG